MQKKFVIYSAMVGGYDDILQPLVVDKRFDYILFSNEIKEKNVGVWQVRPIEYYNPDNTRICRYVKTHPEEMVPGYEASVWMDSNVQILTSHFYDRIEELYNEGILFSTMWHPTRRDIYEEAFAVVNMMVEHEGVVVDWCHRLRKENFPPQSGLCETDVMYRKHNGCLTTETDELWWQCIDNYSRRDQLSFTYALWKKNIPIHYMFGEGKNVRNMEHLRLVLHKDMKRNQRKIGSNEAWLMRHCWKHKEETEKVEALYYKLYAFPFPKLWIALAGQWYRLKDRLKA